MAEFSDFLDNHQRPPVNGNVIAMPKTSSGPMSYIDMQIEADTGLPFFFTTTGNLDGTVWAYDFTTEEKATLARSKVVLPPTEILAGRKMYKFTDPQNLINVAEVKTPYHKNLRVVIRLDCIKIKPIVEVAKSLATKPMHMSKAFKVYLSPKTVSTRAWAEVARTLENLASKDCRGY